MEKKGGQKLTIVLCEAQGGCYTLHLLCWHASITLACLFFKASVNNFKNLRNVRGARIIQGRAN